MFSTIYPNFLYICAGENLLSYYLLQGVAGDEDASAKRLKPTESCKNENGGSDNETEKQKYNQKPPKDYIHVRARRGQATDSHSLAERVMHFLSKISRISTELHIWRDHSVTKDPALFFCHFIRSVVRKSAKE